MGAGTDSPRYDSTTPDAAALLEVDQKEGDGLAEISPPISRSRLTSVEFDRPYMEANAAMYDRDSSAMAREDPGLNASQSVM